MFVITEASFSFTFSCVRCRQVQHGRMVDSSGTGRLQATTIWISGFAGQNEQTSQCFPEIPGFSSLCWYGRCWFQISDCPGCHVGVDRMIGSILIYPAFSGIRMRSCNALQATFCLCSMPAFEKTASENLRYWAMHSPLLVRKKGDTCWVNHNVLLYYSPCRADM